MIVRLFSCSCVTQWFNYHCCAEFQNLETCVQYRKFTETTLRSQNADPFRFLGCLAVSAVFIIVKKSELIGNVHVKSIAGVRSYLHLSRDVCVASRLLHFM
eukprot:g14103.t1